MFKAEVNGLSTLHIPTRQIKSRVDLPWVTHEIVKLTRKRDKLDTKLKRSCSHKSHYTEKFKQLKSTIQKQIRNAYWPYLESVIFSDTRSWSQKKNYFVKHKKTQKTQELHHWTLKVKPTQTKWRRPTYSTNNLNPSSQSLHHSASNN